MLSCDLQLILTFSCHCYAQLASTIMEIFAWVMQNSLAVTVTLAWVPLVQHPSSLL